MDEKSSAPNHHKNTVQQFVTKKLREAILNGTLKKGDRVVQEEWASKLGVSRMPIREALQQLAVEGLVKIEPHKGAVATPITEEDIEEIYSIRTALESLAVVKSLPYLTDDDKKEIENILIKMESLNIAETNIDEYIHLHDQFHKCLRKRCPWQRVNSMVNRLGILPIATNLLVDHYNETQKDHRLIYEAIVRNSPSELKAAIEYHMLKTKNNIMDSIKKLSQICEEEKSEN
ncbi:GntR family transcriptional regulator [Aeribacillus alveayuensis]|uniref:DNA-binding GntR family transcriptional regulator n=1 Tax=Aeribacillus alveayuensis TaxID=279215 RepID=A0ABT9VQ88_9BACI|nr:DNA-binding GntR family transcriptional regulator [Bacillus alveayuensis]